MVDYISKEYIKEHIEACWINGRPKYAPELHEVLSWVDDAPSEDVQPVVRCRNCEHWDDMYGTCYCEDFEVHCQDYYIGDMHTEPDFFCGFGERKGADE